VAFPIKTKLPTILRGRFPSRWYTVFSHLKMSLPLLLERGFFLSSPYFLGLPSFFFSDRPDVFSFSTSDGSLLLDPLLSLPCLSRRGMRHRGSADIDKCGCLLDLLTFQRSFHRCCFIFLNFVFFIRHWWKGPGYCGNMLPDSVWGHFLLVNFLHWFRHHTTPWYRSTPATE